jgi:hypothetical protein
MFKICTFSNCNYFKGTVPRDLGLMVFFMNQFPLSLWVYHWGRFEFFSKIHEDIRSSRCITGVVKFIHFKLSAAWYCSHYLPPLSTTPVVPWQYLPPVTLIPVANLAPVVHFDLRISPWIFEKIWNDPNVIFRGLGEGDSWKNLKGAQVWDFGSLRFWWFLHHEVSM